MIEEVAHLERAIERLAGESQATQKIASNRLREAASTISDDKLKERLYYSRGLIGVQDRTYTNEFEAETTRLTEELADELMMASDAITDIQPEQPVLIVDGEIRGIYFEELEEMRAQIEEFQVQSLKMADFKVLFEALEGVGSLEDLDLENFTIDVRRDEEDQRRRRRRRRSRR